MMQGGYYEIIESLQNPFDFFLSDSCCIKKHIFLFSLLPALVSRSNMFISGIDGGLSLALITISFMAFCLVSIYEILKKDDSGIRKQKDGESEVQNK